MILKKFQDKKLPPKITTELLCIGHLLLGIGAALVLCE